MRISIGGTRKLYSNKDIMFERILKKETRFFNRWKVVVVGKTKERKSVCSPRPFHPPLMRRDNAHGYVCCQRETRLSRYFSYQRLADDSLLPDIHIHVQNMSNRLDYRAFPLPFNVAILFRHSYILLRFYFE